MIFVQVDGDSSTNDTLLALASGAAGGPSISNIDSEEARQLQAALDAVGLPTILGAQLSLPCYVLERYCGLKLLIEHLACLRILYLHSVAATIL